VPLLTSRSAAGVLALLGDETDVFNRRLPELIHHGHDSAVFDLFISLDEDDLLGLAFEKVRQPLCKICLPNGLGVEVDLLVGRTEMTVWSCDSGLSTVLVAVGNLRLTPCWSMGAMSIMMMSSTSMTSTSGVTLISDLTPPLAPPRSIAIVFLLTRKWLKG